MVTAASAEIPRPARLARLLLVDVPLVEPQHPAAGVDPVAQAAHPAELIADESMTRAHRAVGRHAGNIRGGAAGMRAMGSAVELAQRIDHVRERESVTGRDLPFELAPAGGHFREHPRQIPALISPAPDGELKTGENPTL